MFFLVALDAGVPSSVIFVYARHSIFYHNIIIFLRIFFLVRMSYITFCFHLAFGGNKLFRCHLVIYVLYVVIKTVARRNVLLRDHLCDFFSNFTLFCSIIFEKVPRF